MAKRQPPPTQAIVWTRADPAALAAFDPRTKQCTMNCGPHQDDPRSKAERMLLCDECLVDAVLVEKTPPVKNPMAEWPWKSSDPSRAAFEVALRQTWQMVDVFNPAGTPGSYARGVDAGITAALKTMRENYERAIAESDCASQDQYEAVPRPLFFGHAFGAADAAKTSDETRNGDTK